MSYRAAVQVLRRKLGPEWRYIATGLGQYPDNRRTIIQCALHMVFAVPKINARIMSYYSR